MALNIRPRWIILTIFLILVLPALGAAAWVWTTLHFSYSNGERTGYVQKISKKGWIRKTWEGELAMTTVPGTAPQIFQFTVPDDKVADMITKAGGKQVNLMYDQHKGVPSACFGESEYFVTGVKPVGQ